MSIAKRTITRKDADGNPTKRTVWRARIVDPTRPGAASHKREKTFASKAAAQDWETSQRGAVQSGTYISAKAGATTLSEVAESWRATWDAKPLSPRTQHGYEQLLTNHVLPRFGGVKVASIDAKSIQGFINDLAKTHHAGTVHHVYVVLRQCMKTAVSHKLINVNPCTPDSITLPSKRVANANKVQLWMTASELKQLTNAMPEHWRAATVVAGWCGLRAGELWGLRRCDVDILHGRLTVAYALKDIDGVLFAGPTKSHQRRVLNLPKHVADELAKVLDAPGVRVRAVARGKTHPSGYPAIIDGLLTWTDDATSGDRLLFTAASGGPVRHTNFAERTFEKTRDALWPAPHRLNRLRWHDLRHTCASLVISATGNLGIVKQYLGHSSIVLTFDTYGHMLDDTTKSIAEALERIHDDAAAPANVIELHVHGEGS
jgi:integrase